MANGLRFQPEESSYTHSRRPLEVPVYKTPEESVGPIERYVQELRHEAHCRLDAGRAEAIVVEVAGHLNEKADALTGDGIARFPAEKEAVSGFDNPRALVRKLADTAYETRRSRLAQYVSFVTTALFIALFVFLSCKRGVEEVGRGDNRIGWLFLLSATILAVGSFLGLRMRRRAFGSLATILLLVPAVYDGFHTIAPHWLKAPPSQTEMTPRRDIRDRRLLAESRRELLRDETMRLREGIRFYRTHRPGEITLADVPASLRYEGRVIVPNREPVKNGRIQGIKISAFRPWVDISPRPGESFHAHEARTTDNLRRTRMRTLNSSNAVEAARVYWTDGGPAWLRLQEKSLEREEALVRYFDRAEAYPLRWNIVAAQKTLTYPGLMFTALFLLALHIVPAWIGRRAFRLYRQWLWRLRYAA
ncbi:MAG: hypothetical protein SFU56_21605 [Capsulimonadales bacterium]|nr:hypothetical protein [Capsulimonadales bacterium]